MLDFLGEVVASVLVELIGEYVIRPIGRAVRWLCRGVWRMFVGLVLRPIGLGLRWMWLQSVRRG